MHTYLYRIQGSVSKASQLDSVGVDMQFINEGSHDIAVIVYPFGSSSFSGAISYKQARASLQLGHEETVKGPRLELRLEREAGSQRARRGVKDKLAACRVWVHHHDGNLAGRIARRDGTA